MMRGWLLLAAGLLCTPALAIVQTPGTSDCHRALRWDAAFPDRSGNRPVHFVASYVDAHGQTHRLEEWRLGQTHLRRLTDNRIDLHADIFEAANAGEGLPPGQPADYVWQVLDLQTRIDHRISNRGMVRLGMLYSFYGMAHALSQPAGKYHVRAVHGLAVVAPLGMRGKWFEISVDGQPATRVCWLRAAGVPLRIVRRVGLQWETTFELHQLKLLKMPASVFHVNAQGYQIRNVGDEPED